MLVISVHIMINDMLCSPLLLVFEEECSSMQNVITGLNSYWLNRTVSTSGATVVLTSFDIESYD
jgi:hypothetical protein